MRPLEVETIHRLPHRTIESTFPTPGTVSPCVALHTPPGPCKTTVLPTTSRIIHPSTVRGLVSATGADTVLPRCGAVAVEISEDVRSRPVFDGRVLVDRRGSRLGAD